MHAHEYLLLVAGLFLPPFLGIFILFESRQLSFGIGVAFWVLMLSPVAFLAFFLRLGQRRMAVLWKKCIPKLEERLREIEPDQVITTKQFIIAQRRGVYVVVPRNPSLNWNLWPIYFLRLRMITSRMAGKAKFANWFPRRSATWIDGTRILRRKGVFAVPVRSTGLSDRDYVEEFAEGQGILYAVQVFISACGLRYKNSIQELDRTMLLSIMHQISKEKL